MSNIKKHTDVVASMEEFTTNYNNAVYAAPWIVYVGNNIDGYSVIYSNDEKKSHASATPDVIDSLKTRIQKLEDEKVFCYEEEYDALMLNGNGWVTNIDGSRTQVVFDENKLYCIYEDDGPNVEPEEPSEPEEPENGEEEPRNDEEAPRYDEMAPNDDLIGDTEQIN